MNELNNLKSISIPEIKECLKQNSPHEFDKMIIRLDTKVNRANLFFIKHISHIAERQSKIIRFPLYGSIKDNFSDFEGGETKHGNKKLIKSDTLFETLKTKYNIETKELEVNSIINPFDYPIEFDSEMVLQKQNKYFIPDLTYQEQCDVCKGNKYVICDNQDCKGQHVYVCPKCHGSCYVSCQKCKNSGFIICSNCDGSGKVEESICSHCKGRGETWCENCSGRGEVECQTCRAKGNLVCENCYGDKNRFGMIDCNNCMSQGIIAQMVFVETSINKNVIERIFHSEEQINDIDHNEIMIKHTNKSAKPIPTLINTNKGIKKNYDEHSEKYSSIILAELGCQLSDFPRITNEEIYYQIIPCVQFEYMHMITNKTHKVSILNFFNSPEIIFHSNAEEVKKDFKNATKAIGGIASKILKTKSYKTKEDKKNEIILMIYLARADGKFEDEEKEYISNLIGSIDDFTVSEKQKIFNVLNMKILPDLKTEQTTFSSKEKGMEVISNLKNLSISDGESTLQEKNFIEKVKSMLKSNE
jgi:hypothetical protein